MTAQIEDRVIFEALIFNLAGIKGEGLFTPSDHGITAIGFSTACRRGYHCVYKIKDDGLRLAQLNMRISGEDVRAIYEGRGPYLFGKSLQPYLESCGPVRAQANEMPKEWWSGDVRCEALDLLIPFSGGLLIGKDVVGGGHRMGFRAAYRYQTLYEIELDRGRIIDTVDRSETMADIRNTLSKKAGEESGVWTDSKTIAEWVRASFSRDYGL